MPDVDPGQPENPVQQEADWKARYSGQVTVTNRLTAERDDWRKKYEAALADSEQLRSQVALAQTEKTVAVGERDKQLQQIVEAKTQADAELNRLRALETKLKVARKLGRPELIEIADAIPALADEAALEQVMKTFTDWGDKLVQQRERQILAGQTPPPTSVPTQVALPTDPKGWDAYVTSATGAERDKRMEQWRTTILASQK